MAVIELRRVTKTFGDLIAVNALDLKIGPGTVFGFLGPNGAGKTTTIRMLLGLLQSDEGEVEVAGYSLNHQRVQALTQVGYIPDRPFLYPKLTGWELLTLVGRLRRLAPEIIQQRGSILLESLQLTDRAHHLIEQLSHGMRQKLMFCVALLHEPQVLIVDEPMVGLDPKGARKIKQLFASMAAQGKTVFMSTHSLEVAREVCDDVGVIHRGALIARQSPQALIQDFSQGATPSLEEAFLTLTEER